MDDTEILSQIERLVEDGGQRVLGWRDVPVDASVPGPGAKTSMPVMRARSWENPSRVKWRYLGWKASRCSAGR